MTLTGRKHIRENQIRIGRKIADEIIAEQGSASTADVYALMVERDLIDNTIKKYWLASVFRSGGYVMTGEITTGIGHDRLAHIWSKTH